VKPDLSQAEVEALLGEEVRSQSVVEPRDFRRPKRLGASQLAGLGKRISSALPVIERAMTTSFGDDLALSLVHLDEVTRSSFLDSLEDQGFFAQACIVDGQEGWVRWAPEEARQAIERSLGCGSSSPTDAPLSGLERSLAGGFAFDLAASIATQLGTTASMADSYVEKRLLQASIDAAPVGDEQRLSVTIQLSAESFTSQLHLYLPSVSAPKEELPQQSIPTALPEHLNGVGVTLSAELASLELPLQEFLDLEEGDVIALGPKREMQARLVVDGRPAGSAVFGRDGEKLALRVEDLHVEPNN